MEAGRILISSGPIPHAPGAPPVIRRLRPKSLFILTFLLAPVLPGCGGDPEDDLAPHGPATGQPDASANAAGGPNAIDPATGIEAPSSEADPATILHSVIELIRKSSENPGGANFDNAKDNLNHFFASSNRNDFKLPEASREF